MLIEKASVSVLGEGGGAALPVSPGENCVALGCVSSGKGGVAFLPVNSEGVASVSVGPSERGVAFLPVSSSEGGMPSLFILLKLTCLNNNEPFCIVLQYTRA